MKMNNLKSLSLVIVCLLAVFGVAGIVFAGSGDSSGSGDAMFCEAPSISVKDQLGQPVENAVIAVTYTNGSDSKSMDLTTPVSGTVTLGAKSGTYTFELKSVPAAYTIGQPSKIVQDCHDGKSMAGKTFTVSNNTASPGATGSTVISSTILNETGTSTNLSAVQSLVFNIIEQSPEFKAYVLSLVQQPGNTENQPAPTDTTVPNLVGMTQNQAKTALANAGLLLGNVGYCQGGDPQVVSEQSIPSDTSIAINSTIDLVVYSGHTAPTPLPLD